MREIKFRGKCSQSKRWVYGWLLTNKLGTYIVTEENPHECTQNHYIEIDEYCRVVPESVGQYTGLCDKNGKEIYEGDIVELTNTYKGMNTKSIVEIDFIDFTFAGKWAEEYSPSGYMYNPLGSYNFPIVTIEVIGNIYENPDLIEGGAE